MYSGLNLTKFIIITVVNWQSYLSDSPIITIFSPLVQSSFLAEIAANILRLIIH
jgi:hypothetical protein